MIHALIRRFSPPIRIHVWGGFGSQLFALVAAWRISSKYQWRKVKLVFHSSGVTERSREIPSEWLGDFSIEEKRDFHKHESSQAARESGFIKQFFTRYLDSAIRGFGIVARANSNFDFKKIPPWILDIRGHYTDLFLEDFEVARLVELLNIETHGIPLSAISLHYRLGDLLYLENKSFIKPERILQTLEEDFDPDMSVNVFSDSATNEVTKLLSSYSFNKNFHCFELSPIETIRLCVNSKEFLGSNSKISLWIAIFRLRKNIGLTAIPRELQHHIRVQLGEGYYQPSLLIY